MSTEARLCDLDIDQVARGISAGTLSPVEVTQSLLQRIADIDPRVKAYVTVTGEDALRFAEAAEKAVKTNRYRGPLHGIPIAIKDIYDTKGVRTTACSKVREDYVPADDCTVVRKLRDAGAIILGKLTTHEFAFGFDSAPTRNPWNLHHIPSGSSGGSGAAVAAGLCFGATGSDTGGSIRAPAAATGVCGIKPTYGRVSKSGVAVLSWSLDHAGPLAKSARDLAILLGAMAGVDPADPHTRDVPVPDYVAALTGDIRGLRIGIPRNYFFDDVLPAVGDAVMTAANWLESLGAIPVSVTIDGLEGVLKCFRAIAMAEASTYHQQTLRASPELFGEEMRLLLEAGELTLATTYINAQRARHALKTAFHDVFRQIDVLITPTLPTTALKVGQATSRIGAREESVFAASARFCAPFNMTGLPAASIPCGFGPDGLPIGLQIVGKPFDEATMLKVADAFERQTHWHSMRPALAQ